MNKSLENNLKRTASGLGLAGLLAMSSGCLGSAIIAGYGAQCNQPGAYAFGNALNQTEAAREGRTTVIVPQGNNVQNEGSSVYTSPQPREKEIEPVEPVGGARLYLLMTGYNLNDKKLDTISLPILKEAINGGSFTMDTTSEKKEWIKKTVRDYITRKETEQKKE